MPFNIPMPEPFEQTLMKGVNTGSGMFSRLMQPILEREKQAQLERHFQEQLKLSKAAAGRAASLAPLQRRMAELNLQKAEMEADPIKKMAYIQKIMQGIGNMGTENQGAAMQTPSQESMIPYQGIGMPNFNEMQNPAIAPPSQKSIQEGFGGMNFTPQQQMALGMAGIKIPKLYETPEQKSQQRINTAITINEAKSNQKKIDEIETTAKALLPYLGKVNTIEDILARKPELAGRTTQLADFLGMTKDEDVGTFLSAAQALQAHMAKEMSSRGGYGVSKLVEQAKPNLGKSTAYNLGVTKELKAGMKESFQQMKNEYERLSHKKFPYSFEQYFKEQTGTNSTGNNASSKKRLKFNVMSGRLE